VTVSGHKVGPWRCVHPEPAGEGLLPVGQTRDGDRDLQHGAQRAPRPGAQLAGLLHPGQGTAAERVQNSVNYSVKSNNRIRRVMENLEKFMGFLNGYFQVWKSP